MFDIQHHSTQWPTRESLDFDISSIPWVKLVLKPVKPVKPFCPAPPAFSTGGLFIAYSCTRLLYCTAPTNDKVVGEEKKRRDILV